MFLFLGFYTYKSSFAIDYADTFYSNSDSAPRVQYSIYTNRTADLLIVIPNANANYLCLWFLCRFGCTAYVEELATVDNLCFYLHTRHVRTW